MAFDYTTGSPDNLTGGGPARMQDIQGPFYDIRAYLNTAIGAGGGGGSTGGSTPVLATAAILDVGVQGQIRAGRQLTVADFTSLGLVQPVGLWNLSDLTNLGSDGRALANKAGVTFGAGINGFATTSAVFDGLVGSALYIVDGGTSADPYRIRAGSWGCWARTAKRVTLQALIGKWSAAAGTRSYLSYVDTTNVAGVQITDGTTSATVLGVSDIADDRWHWTVVAFDGTTLRLYVDGVLEATATFAALLNSGASTPFNIGSYAADSGAAAVSPHFGRVDEAFVTGDVLTEDQVRCLYAAKLTHTLGVTPTAVRLNVHRRRKGGNLANTDFPAQPLRLYNFDFTVSSTVGWGDAGTNNSGQLTPAGGSTSVAGAAGDQKQALGLSGVGVGAIATDAVLPAGTATRTYGCWFKTSVLATNMGIMGWGTNFTNDASLRINTSGQLIFASGPDTLTLPQVISDGLWHHAVAVEDNTAGDYRRKLYLDGRIQAGSTVLTSLTLLSPGVATGFRIGANANGTQPFNGQIDGVFVAGTAYTAAQVATLYAVGSQDLGVSPKNPGDHVERVTASDVLWIGDTLDSQHTVDLSVVS